MSRAWMPFYIGDYLADTQHLTTLQHGAYCLLIMAYWQRGGLPNDEQAIAGISRLNRDQWRSNSQAIAKLFLPGWKHKRIEQELEKANILSEKRALAGRKGGLFNRGKNNVERFTAAAIAKQTDTQSQSHRTSSFGTREESLAAGSLASGPLNSPLARPPELGAKRPSEVSRAELDAIIAARRQPSALREN